MPQPPAGDDWRSLRVPATVVQRAAGVGRWLAPYALAGLVAAAGYGWRWFESRASRVDVGAVVSGATAEARAAKATAFHAEVLAKGHAVELRAIWSHVVAMRAELVVLRAYGGAPAAKRSEYIAEAQAFYEREYQLQLKPPNSAEPAEAARAALAAKWRPDR